MEYRKLILGLLCFAVVGFVVYDTVVDFMQCKTAFQITGRISTAVLTLYISATCGVLPTLETLSCTRCTSLWRMWSCGCCRTQQYSSLVENSSRPEEPTDRSCFAIEHHQNGNIFNEILARRLQERTARLASAQANPITVTIADACSQASNAPAEGMLSVRFPQTSRQREGSHEIERPCTSQTQAATPDRQLGQVSKQRHSCDPLFKVLVKQNVERDEGSPNAESLPITVGLPRRSAYNFPFRFHPPECEHDLPPELKALYERNEKSELSKAAKETTPSKEQASAIASSSKSDDEFNESEFSPSEALSFDEDIINKMSI